MPHMLDEIESLIDRNGVAAVLEAISVVAEQKADHIVASYQDVPLAKQWRIASQIIGGAINNIEKLSF